MMLNDRALKVFNELQAQAECHHVEVSPIAGATVVDCGVKAMGGITAGLALARICLADLANVSLVPSTLEGIPGPMVQVQTDHPVQACLASQYAGWQIKGGTYFAMGSGPFRAAAGREKLFETLLAKETSVVAVGVLEARKLPTAEAIEYIQTRLPSIVAQLKLAVAPAASLTGGVQVVARSVETALHKLHELGFDVHKVKAGYGTAPLPPVAKDELGAIGRTNDAILYGGRVTLWVHTEDHVIEAVGPKIPANASKDYGEPFSRIYEKYGDFYKIDPLLFSPAEVTFNNLATGRCFTFGSINTNILRTSFFG